MADTDRELLEMAAKAAGHALVWGEKYAIGGDLVDCTDMPYIKSVHPDELDAYWNPLTDDGDALRLAVKFGLTICNDHESAGSVCCTRGDTEEFPAVMSGKVGDPPGITPEDYAATRRAIVRAAAAIGQGK